MNVMNLATMVGPLLVCAALSTPALAQDAKQPPTITTPGEATIKRAADRAFVTVATEARALKSDDARRLGAQAMADVQTALKGTGLAADAIRTLAFSVEPDMAYVDGHSKLNGYIARNQIEVRVDDLEKLPAVLDAANTPKNVTLSISGPRFDVKDRDALEMRALSAAVENAVLRARAIADGAKAQLGAIVHIENETAPTSSPMPMMRMAVAAAPSTPITPGEVSIEAHVTLTIVMTAIGR